jgi:hypothetical protein
VHITERSDRITMYTQRVRQSVIFAIVNKIYENKSIMYTIYQGRPNGRSRTISESIMLEFIFRPRARKLIVVVMNKLLISFICIVFVFYSGL